LRLGVAPVIVSDDWTPPDGIDWEKCSIRVEESQIARIPEILEELKPHARAIGLQARKEYEKHFSPQAVSMSILQELATLSHGQRMIHLRRTGYLARHVLSQAYWFLYFTLIRIRDSQNNR